MQVVILAGGRGSRLNKYTKEIPKPLIKICGKTILEYQIENLKKYGLTEIIISVSYLGDQIIDYFQDGSKFGVQISYIEEKKALGTGGALSLLKDKIKNDFILLFGDIILNIHWKKFIDFYYKNGKTCAIVVHPNSHPFDSDVIVSNSDDRLERVLFKNKERDYYRNLVKSGIHIFNKSIFINIKQNEKQDLEKDILSKMLNNNENIYCYKTAEYIKDMGTLERLEQVTQDIQNEVLEKKSLYNKQKCIFLDRDGTINVLNGLINKVDELKLEQNVSEAIKMINQSGYLTIVITNQPVVARNMCTLEGLNIIHSKMDMLLAEQGAYVDDLYFCPHHPDRGYPEENKEYKIKCNCRKPSIGMIFEAVKKYNIDITKSYFIGDTTIDIQTGKNAGCKTVLLETGMAGRDEKFNVSPDYVKSNLLDAVKFILNKDVYKE
ncbi:HAD-IIIA family hydrolase [Clostridium butyricum]|uniref:HAD-IIIA family hydrolase n=1 Tax=Clostridium butyricum TaxID=1492 RepID=UPI0013D66B04|nr:HAD-IIIA family hydrolase [Clostridium butyricum]MCQ2022953.1 HAD-IIIA family hydrolase [Clostridium butyricum]NFB70101.1 HAD-IIIA family hydrolase [Clostridium butyricum]NFB89888.1 HAD-IIIA family hydrolase [Clostridium butyricum]